jgi:hypothetical protein
MNERFVAAIGPVWSGWGGKHWSLFLAPDRIIAYPYSFGESLRLGLRFSLKVRPADPGEAARGLVRQNIGEEGLPRGRGFRRYPVHLVRSITLRSNSTANTITIRKISGEEDEYSIALRNETDLSRGLLADLYPSLYAEKDFPATAIGKLLRK